MGQFAYDIRGVYPDVVNEKTAYNAGRAAALFLKAKNAIVGRDCRTSSLALKKSLIYGLTDQGCNVIDIGYCNTPMTYYASNKHHTLMITASHNPKQYNGVKITRKGVEPIGSHNGLDKIEQKMNACHFPNPKKLGNITVKNILPEYVRAVRKLVNGHYTPLKVLVDCGNGMAAHVVPHLFKGLPVRYKLLDGVMDGTFPNHTPNPAIPENTKDLEKAVKKGKYDLGIAYDGDCDRVYFVDEKGKRVRPEFALLLFAKRHMKKGQVLVSTVNSSRIVQEQARAWGYKHYPSQIGHTEIPRAMKKHQATFAAEITGHFYFKAFHYADSGDISTLMMLDILSRTNKKLSQLVGQFKKYATSEELNYQVKNPEKTFKRVENAYKNCKHVNATKIPEEHPRTCTIHQLDGISVDAGDHWFNLRISKTEGFVRLNVEAKNKQKLTRAIKNLARLVH
ncbi:phosphomannomutase/phosphoglucomutase [Candidatus Woesearchaeota archaeon]|nr:phosphomannomutase/phosphoglucomutase [Candidatus Woesearchaeota archaeon]